MFEYAIQKGLCYIGHMKTVERIFPTNDLVVGGATFIIVNDEGWVLTCKHVAREIEESYKLEQIRQNISNACSLNPDTPIHQIAAKFGILNGNSIEIAIQLVHFTTFSRFSIIYHPVEDLSLIKFEINAPIERNKDQYPVFSTKDSDYGKFLCRLGFPFNEFNNFQFNEKTDSVQWTSSGKIGSPFFPLEGMHLRNLKNKDGDVTMFQVSNPNIPGHSGGPLIDKNGVVFGICTGIETFDLDRPHFQLDKISNKYTKHQPNQNLSIGRCIHASVIVKFLKDNNVKFTSI